MVIRIIDPAKGVNGTVVDRYAARLRKLNIGRREQDSIQEMRFD
jgi:hypothetical protein